MAPYFGACHCGQVRFRIDAEPAELTVCDCSLCAKKNAVMTQVHESELTILAGEGALTEYRWNTGVARHFFCSTCGIYPFHRKRSVPDSYGVNIACLEDFDPSGVPVRRADGKSMSVV